MHYIRLLKPPKLQVDNKVALLSTVVTVTTDLGDDFLLDDLGINCTVIGTDGIELAKSHAQWKTGSRALPISMELRVEELKSSHDVLLRLTPGDESRGNSTGDGTDDSTILRNLAGRLVLRPVFGGESARLSVPGSRGTGQATTQANRTFSRKFGKVVILEETGESIARHVWDAGVGLAAALTEWRSCMRLPAVRKLLSNNAGVRVVELGCGTGLVGLALATAIPGCHVDVTDLAEHTAFVHGNVAANTGTLAPGSSVEFVALDWEAAPPAEVSGAYDMVVAADVTYNADSSAALVRTIAALEERSAGAVVLIAMKTRHGSEAVFFDDMAAAGFQVGGRQELAAPVGALGDEAAEAQVIQIFTFERRRA